MVTVFVNAHRYEKIMNVHQYTGEDWVGREYGPFNLSTWSILGGSEYTYEIMMLCLVFEPGRRTIRHFETKLYNFMYHVYVLITLLGRFCTAIGEKKRTTCFNT
jgi:hypothetical protein